MSYVRVINKDLIDRLPSRDFPQNQFYADACTAYERLSKHNIRVRNNKRFLHMYIQLSSKLWSTGEKQNEQRII